MKSRFSPIGFAVFAASIGLAGIALAQSFPTNFAQRCAPEELRAGLSLSSQDPCAPQFALFGLKGPTVIGSRAMDVETTGAVRAIRADRKRPTEK
jgi:hypothetical protein